MIDLAVQASQNVAPVIQPESAEPIADSESTRRAQVQLAATDVIDSEVIAAAIAPNQSAQEPATQKPSGNGVVVFSVDTNVVTSVEQAARDRFPVYVASNIVQVVKALTEHQPGVLITDITEDRRTIQTMTARLKQHLPELVTIVVSAHRDALDMIWLINHGQIFRFLRKPLSSGRCAVSLQAALQHHRTLRTNPVLAERHTVDTSDDPSGFTGMLDKLKSVRRLWA
jgi:serine/threonine-protein kinase